MRAERAPPPLDPKRLLPVSEPSLTSDPSEAAGLAGAQVMISDAGLDESSLQLLNCRGD